MENDWFKIVDAEGRKVGRPRTSPVKGMVFHHTEGSVSMDGNGSWSNKTNTGAQYYIDPNGTVHRWAPDNIKMNHAGAGRGRKGDIRPDLGNENTLGVEIMTEKGKFPNAKQLKAAHELARRKSAEHGFTAKDVVGHGEIAIGHRHATEGSFARKIRELGFDATIDFDQAALEQEGPHQEPQLVSGPTPVTRKLAAIPDKLEFTPSDVQPIQRTSYEKLDRTEHEVEPTEVRLPSLAEPVTDLAVRQSRTANYSLPDPEDEPDATTPEIQVPGVVVSKPQVPTVEATAPPTEAPADPGMNVAAPSGTVVTGTVVDKPAAPILQPTTFTPSSMQRLHRFSTEEDALRAQQAEAKALQGPTWREQAEAEWDTNWLGNWVEEAYASHVDEKRSKFDENFAVPTDYLNGIDNEDDKRFILESNNAYDFVARAAELDRRVKGREILSQVGYPARLVTAVPDLVFSIVPGVAIGALATTVAPVAGASTLARVAVGLGTEMLLNAPEHYYMYKSGQADMKSTLLSLGIMGGFGIYVYRGAGKTLRAADTPHLKPDVHLLQEFADDTADDVAAAIAKEEGVPAPTPPPRTIEEYGYVPRVRFDEENTVKVYRDPDLAASRTAAIHYDRDIERLTSVFRNFWSETKTSARRMRDALEAFERQAGYLQEAAAIYVKVPSSLKNPLEHFQGGLVYGTRTAGEVVAPKQGEVVVKLALPKGSRYIDVAGHKIGPNEGSMLVKIDKGHVKIPGKFGVLKASERTLKYAGEKVLDFDDTIKAARPVKFTQYDLEYRSPTAGNTGRLQFATGYEKHTGRRLDLEELTGLNDDLIVNGLEALAVKKPLADIMKAKDELAEALDKHVDELDDEGEMFNAHSTAGAGSVRLEQTKLTDNTKDVEAFVKDHDSLVRDDLNDLGTLLSRVMPKLSEGRLAKFNPNKLYQHVANHLFFFGTDRSQKALSEGVGQVLTHEEVTRGWLDAFHNRYSAGLIDNFRKYVEEHGKGIKNGGLPAKFQYKLRRKFNDEVDLVQRLKYNGKPIPAETSPAVLAMAKKEDELYKEYFDLFLDPGKMWGKPGEFGAVGEMDKATPWRAGWTPRYYDGAKINELDAQIKNPRWFNSLLAGSMRDRLTKEGLTEAQIQEIADMMVNTIRKARSGISEIVDAFHGHGSMRAVIEAMKSDPLNRISQKTLTILENLENKVGNDATAKAGTNTFARALLDENFKLTLPGGRKLGIADVVITDRSAIFNKYAGSNTARIAFGGWQIPNPIKPGEYIVNGVFNTGDWKVLLDKVARVEYEVRPDMAAGTLKENALGAIKAMEMYFDTMTGRHMDQGEALMFIKNMSYMQYLGNAGLAQAIELPNVIARHGLYALNRVPSFKNLKKHIFMLGQQEDTAALKDLIGMMARDTGLFTNIRRGALGVKLDEESSNSMLQATGKSGKAEKAWDGAKLFVAEGARFVFLTSGLAPLTQASQLMASAGAWDKMAAASLRAGGDYSKLSRRYRTELARYGLSKTEGERLVRMLANKEVVIRKKGMYGHIIDTLDEGHELFDREIWLKTALGVNRVTYQLVQENNFGSTHRWMNHPAARAFLTLRTFLFGAYTKQMMRHTEQIGGLLSQAKADIAAKNFSVSDGLGDTAIQALEPTTALLGQIAVAAGMVYALNELRIVGMSDKRKREARRKLEKQSYAELVGAAVSRTGSLGMIPTIWNTPMQYLAPSARIGPDVRTSGLSNSLLGIPALGTAENFFKVAGAAGEAAFTSERFGADDVKKTQQLLTNQWAVGIITNVLTDRLLDLPAK